MFTVRRIGWTLTGVVVILWTIVVVVLIQTNDPPPGSEDRPLLFQVLGSWVLIGLLWIALVLIALIWIVLWFGGRPRRRPARPEVRVVKPSCARRPSTPAASGVIAEL
jgi:hypothetical protein